MAAATADPRTQAVRDNLAEIRAQTTQQLTDLFRGLPDYRDADREAFVKAATPILDAGKKTTAQQTAAYLKGLAADAGEELDDVEDAVEAGVKGIRGGIPSSSVLARPFNTLYNELQNEKQFVDALDSAATRLEQITSTDLQLAQTMTAQEVMARNADRIVGWARVSDPDGCELCLEASEQTYRTEDLMPIHPHCSCTVEPVFATEPGDELNDRVITSVEDWEKYPAAQREAIEQAMIDRFGIDVDRGARNLLELIDRPEFATAEYRDAMSQWYRTEGHRIDVASRAAGQRKEIGYATVAAFSPQNAWSFKNSPGMPNLFQAREAMFLWKENPRFNVTRELIADVEKQFHGYKVKIEPGVYYLHEIGVKGTPGYRPGLSSDQAKAFVASLIGKRCGYTPTLSNTRNALEVLRTQSPNALSGAKVRTFYNHFVTGGAWAKAATIDTWMLKALTGVLNPVAIDKYGTAPGGIRSIVGSHSPAVQAVIDYVRGIRGERLVNQATGEVERVGRTSLLKASTLARGGTGTYPGFNEAVLRAWREYNARPGVQAMRLGDFQAWVWAASKDAYSPSGPLFASAIRLAEAGKGADRDFAHQVIALTSRERMLDRVERTGGFTFRYNGYEPHVGYAVAVESSHTRRIPVDQFRNMTKAEIEDLLRVYITERPELMLNPHLFIGGWVDDGYVWFDEVETVATRAEAIALGTARNERGVYDLMHQVTIPTGGTGGYA